MTGRSPLTPPERSFVYDLVKKGGERPEVLEKVKLYRAEHGLPEIDDKHINQAYTTTLKSIRRDTQHYKLNSLDRRTNRKIVNSYLEDLEMLTARIKKRAAEDENFIITEEYQSLWDRKLKVSEILRKITEANEQKKFYRRPAAAKPEPEEADYAERLPGHLTKPEENGQKLP